MNSIFKNYKNFIIVFVDDILIFSFNMREYLGHFQKVFKLFVDSEIINSKKKNEAM